MGSHCTCNHVGVIPLQRVVLVLAGHHLQLHQHLGDGARPPVHHLALVAAPVLGPQPRDHEVAVAGHREPVVVREHEVAHAEDLQRVCPQPADLGLALSAWTALPA